MPSISPDPHKNALRFADTVFLCVAFFLAANLTPALRSLFDSSGAMSATLVQSLSPNRRFEGLGELHSILWVLALMVTATVLSMEVLSAYNDFLGQSRRRLVLQSIFGPALGLASLTLAFYIVRFPGYSRLFLFTFVMLSILGLLSFRLLFSAFVERRAEEGVYSRETALIGAPESLQPLAQFFSRRFSLKDRRLVGYFSLHETVEQGGRGSVLDLPRLGSVAEIGDALIHQAIEDVVVVLPSAGAPWLPRVLQACDYFRIPVHVVPEPLLAAGLNDLHLVAGPLGALPAVTLMPEEENEQASAYRWKRLTDVIVSAAALILLAPLFALIALAIKITTPRLRVLYPWKVVGYRGRRFTGYKFTTMIADADERKQDLMAQNEMSGPVFKIANDPRVTPLGRFLRKFSLNELPQFWSVLIGDMSLVGPRPAGPHELVRYELWHKRKLSVQPGITCYWQIRGRNKITSFDDWVRMDLEYIQNRSPRTDWQILLRTAWVVVRGTGS